MNRNLSTTLLVLFAFACGSTPRPPEMTAVDEVFADEATVKAASAASPKDVEAALDYRKRSEEAFEDDEIDDATYYAGLAELKILTALERLSERRAKKRIIDAKREITEAKKRTVDAEDQQAKFSLRIQRIEKILALQSDLESEKAKSRAQKKQLTADLAQAQKEKEEALEKERTERELRELISAVRAKLETARALGGEDAAAKQLKAAENTLALAERSTLDGKLADSRTLIAQADKDAEATLAASRKAFAAQGKRLNVLEEQEALLAAAAKIVPTSAKQQRGVVVTLYEMFAPGESEVLDERVDVLARLGELARRYDGYPVLIEGYTDSRGRDNDNVELSTSRAESVRAQLVRGGLDPDRARAMGYGESRPVADNSTAEGRAKNRRVEMVFLFR